MEKSDSCQYLQTAEYRASCKQGNVKCKKILHNKVGIQIYGRNNPFNLPMKGVHKDNIFIVIVKMNFDLSVIKIIFYNL